MYFYSPLIFIMLLVKKTIIFDLDETLIHSYENTETFEPESASFVNLSIKFPTGEDIDVNFLFFYLCIYITLILIYAELFILYQI